ncbi:TolB family protein [Kangiella aquimarina]|uniref:PD40 domain-containing protein n=1 Tax=Kangiella aquimarina TaxID=261965 RepID=A0ABZ0X391_9GAMM|nr:PD40 domain-containing protein [Kangiella aquimarina]WQG84762.1 PD40 domain-containing protein [Kangiella aquimarina]
MTFTSRSVLLLTAVLFFSASVLAEEETPSIPSTDITIIPIKSDGKLIKVEAGNALNVLHHDGYDNQPHFSKDGKQLYFTRMLDQQTDIFVYRFDDKKLSNITNTQNISEYSPTVYNPSSLSVIGVNPEGQQHLRLVSLVGDSQKVLNPEIEPVGYHAWLNTELATVFVLGDVMTLQLFDINSEGQSEPLIENIGRCLQRIEENKVSFTQVIDGQHHLFTLNQKAEVEPTGIVLPDGVQDYVWWDSEGVLVGQNSQLWYISSAQKKQVADLQELKINNITRLALHNTEQKLAIVHE